MDWNSSFHSKYLRGGLCAVLIAAILLGLWLPGTGLKEAQPDDPLQGEGVREITVLKLGENLEQLNTISVPSGGQTKSTEPNDKASETRPEETQPDSSTDDGSDGQENGNQGADGGEVSPSELSLVLTWNAKGIACAAGNTQAFSVSSYELNEDLVPVSRKPDRNAGAGRKDRGRRFRHRIHPNGEGADLAERVAAMAPGGGDGPRKSTIFPSR